MVNVAIVVMALVLALVPATVADLEKHPKWGRAWRVLLPLFVCILGITGFIQGVRSSDALKEQARKAYTAIQISATKDDMHALLEHMDQGFEKVIAAINALRTGKATPKQHEAIPPVVTTPVLPPPIVEHIRYAISRIASSDSSAPYGLQIVIQTDTTIQPVGLKITFDGEIARGDFFVAGQSSMLSVATAMSEDKKSFILSFKYPPFTPESPLVVRIESAREVHIMAMDRVPPIF